MPNGTYGGVRGRKTKVGRKLLRFPPTRFHAVLLSNAAFPTDRWTQLLLPFYPFTFLPLNLFYLYIFCILIVYTIIFSQK